MVEEPVVSLVGAVALLKNRQGRGRKRSLHGTGGGSCSELAGVHPNCVQAVALLSLLFCVSVQCPPASHVILQHRVDSGLA